MEKQEKPKNQAALIFAIADMLRGGWKQHEYQDVILPLVTLKRIDSVLIKTKQKVLQDYNQFHGKMSDEALGQFLEKSSGFKFYNTSPYDFNKLLNDAEHIQANFIKYLDGYSANVRDIVDKFEFNSQLKKLKDGNLLFLIIQDLNKVNLSPDAISNHDMGYIYEELIRKFSEQSNETAGEHYTPREVIRLMVRLLLEPNKERIEGKNKIIELYDPCCGTGGMLTIGKDYILKNINSEADVYLYGQELNPQTYAIAKSDIMIKGEDADNIKGGTGDSVSSTLSNDQFFDKTFDFVIANPPYGVDWKKDREAVEAEASRGEAGRFPAGTPAVSDGQMLFLQHMLSKIRPVTEGGGRVAVVHNGSPLFTGSAGSGPSNIRKYILENDLLEAIIALPTNMFYNTGIATFIWVLTNNKPENRRGKIQLVNASDIFHKLRKNLGQKNKELSAEDINKVFSIYTDFAETKRSKIFKNDDFGYTQVTVEYDDGKDTENIPLNDDIDEYFAREVEPYLKGARLNRKKDKVGYEIPFNRYFYEYKPPRDLADIDADLSKVTREIVDLLRKVKE